MSGVLIERRNLDIETCAGRRPVKMKAEIKVTYVQAKGCQRSPANHWKLGERQGKILSQKKPALQTS